MNTPPELDLTSVYAKLDRANEHFKAVDAEISKWIDAGRYEPFTERGAYGTRIGLAVTQVGPPPDLIRWAVIIGDCINNLRSALDHLINAFTKVSALYTPPSKKERITFVIIDDPTEFEKARNKRLAGFDSRFASALETLQPFKRKHPVLPPLLSIIRDLSNADKHRLLQVAGAGIANIDATFIGDAALGAKVCWINPEPIQHNDVICIIESSKPDPNLAFRGIRAGVEISIWHGLREGSTDAMAERSGYSALLPLLIEEVRFVIETFKRTI